MPRTASPFGFLEPMLPSLVDQAPEGDTWIHEIKYDGYRTQLAIAGKDTRAFTRNGFDWTDRYGPIVEAARSLRCLSAVLDGEICVQDEGGVTRFNALRSAIRNKPERLIFFAFDLLSLDGEDLRADPLLARRLRLHDLVGSDPVSRIHFSPDYEGDAKRFFRAADRQGLEGVVSKRVDSPYTAGQSRAWLKTKCFTLGDFQVIGVERTATGVPEALLATTGDKPAYVGRAVVGLGGKDRERFWADLARLGTPQSRLAGVIAKRKANWVKEGLVARVRHLRGEEMLRHASLKAIGPRDELPSEVEVRHPNDE